MPKYRFRDLCNKVASVGLPSARSGHAHYRPSVARKLLREREFMDAAKCPGHAHYSTRRATKAGAASILHCDNARDVLRIVGMLDIVSRVATTGKLLVRSGIEIDRLLSAMVQDHAPVSATLPGQLMFLSRLVHVDPLKQRLVIAYSDYKEANSALLKSPTVVFKANHRGAKFAFSCRRPRSVSHAGQQCIEIESPPMVLATQQEKVKVHTEIAKAPPDLRCQLPMGVISLEARLVDMSLDRRAFLLGEPGIPVCAGTSVRGARITPSGAEPVVVDIEVKYVIQTTLPDGERVTRIGCHIVGSDEAMEQIIRRFIINLE